MPFLLAAICWSCKDDDESAEISQNRKTNNWIYQNMKYYYLWNNQIPYAPDYTKDPETFFYSLLAPYNQTTHEGDRFSWIQENYVDLLNSLSGVSSSDVGFEYYTIKGYTAFVVVYVKPNTDAETKGLKRGMEITAVNGVNITQQNYTALLRQGKNEYELDIVDPNDGTSMKKTVSVMPDYAENPIYKKDVFQESGKTIGYLIYNFFAADSGNGTSSYDRALNQVFKDFKNQGVEYLVLDLRYNGGGSIMSAIFMASALVNNRSVDDVFSKNEFNAGFQQDLVNEYGSDYINDYFYDKVVKFDDNGNVTEYETISDLGNQLKGVYILTGNYTASASELIINGLTPYLNDKLHLIGDITYGKNVGSISIYKENDSKNKWGMQPIVLRTSNKNGFSDYGGGFTPHTIVKEFAENGGKLLPLGDLNEPLLKVAVEQITGIGSYSQAKSVNNIDVNSSSIIWKRGALQMFVDENKYKINNRQLEMPDNIE